MENGHTGARSAVLYARVSTKGQADNGYSLRQQVEALRAWCEAEGYEVLEEVSDPGYSGASLERPGLDRVRDLVQSENVSVVLAQDRDRFAREPAYLYLLREEFAARGTRLLALNRRGDDSPEGELTDGILDQLAKFERAKTAERSRRGKVRKVAEGKLMRGSRAPYGFDYDEDGAGLVVNEEQMRVVRRIVEMLAVEGESLGGVVRRLHAGGVPSPTSDFWYKSTLKKLITKDLYRPLTRDEVAALVPEGLISEEVACSLDPERVYGLWVFGGERTERKMAVPVPLAEGSLAPPRALVDAARERLAANGRRRPPSVQGERFWQLSGGIVRCGSCGSVLSPKSRRRPTYTDFWYMCRQRRHHNGAARNCPHRTMYNAEKLEAIVWNGVYGLVSDPERLLRQYEEHIERERGGTRGDPEREARDLAGKLQKLEGRRSGYLDLAADGDMSRGELRGKLGDLEEQRRGLEKALREAEGRKEALAEDRINYAHLDSLLLQLNRIDLACATPEDRRRLYEAMRLLATVDRDGTIRLTGIFDPDIYLPDVLRDPPDPLAPYQETPEKTTVTVDTSDTRRSPG